MPSQFFLEWFTAVFWQIQLRFDIGGHPSKTRTYIRQHACLLIIFWIWLSYFGNDLKWIYLTESEVNVCWERWEEGWVFGGELGEWGVDWLVGSGARRGVCVLSIIKTCSISNANQIEGSFQIFVLHKEVIMAELIASSSLSAQTFQSISRKLPKNEPIYYCYFTFFTNSYNLNTLKKIVIIKLWFSKLYWVYFALRQN